VGLLVAAGFASGGLQLGLWGLALLLDMGGPFLFGAEGRKLVPGHFAEHHGGIIIIALGESIVAIGAGASARIEAGVVGLKKTLTHVGDPLGSVPAAAMLGGAALYLLAHVAFRWRNIHRFNAQRLLCAAVLVAAVPLELALKPSPLVPLAALAVLLGGLIVYETIHFAELRERLRHQLAPEEASI
jgi:low temperature requirement protein LtrA